MFNNKNFRSIGINTDATSNQDASTNTPIYIDVAGRSIRSLRCDSKYKVKEAHLNKENDDDILETVTLISEKLSSGDEFMPNVDIPNHWEDCSSEIDYDGLSFKSVTNISENDDNEEPKHVKTCNGNKEPKHVKTCNGNEEQANDRNEEAEHIETLETKSNTAYNDFSISENDGNDEAKHVKTLEIKYKNNGFSTTVYDSHEEAEYAQTGDSFNEFNWPSTEILSKSNEYLAGSYPQNNTDQPKCSSKRHYIYHLNLSIDQQNVQMITYGQRKDPYPDLRVSQYDNHIAVERQKAISTQENENDSLDSFERHIRSIFYHEDPVEILQPEPEPEPKPQPKRRSFKKLFCCGFSFGKKKH